MIKTLAVMALSSMLFVGTAFAEEKCITPADTAAEVEKLGVKIVAVIETPEQIGDLLDYLTPIIGYRPASFERVDIISFKNAEEVPDYQVAKYIDGCRVNTFRFSKKVIDEFLAK